MTKEAILEKALTLAPEERHELIQQLLRSLEEPMDPDIEKAWRVEVERRITEIDTGEVELIPAEEVFAAYAKKFARKDPIGS